MIATGSTVAGYRIDRVLGAGGMGTVYLAQNPELPRRDALKVLSAELSHDPSFRARFIREADIAASLQHPNIVAIYSRGETHAGQLWIAMQYVEGTDADAALRRGTMTPARAVHIIGEVARALDFANDHHIVHRDIKPANFLLSGDHGPDERVLLGDFGIARGLDDYGLTLTGSIISTMAYAAPEVLAGSGFDRRADLYSLGCSLFRLLTGNPPFSAAAGNGPAAVMMAHLHHPPPRVSDQVPGLPAALDTVIATALAKNPGQRYASAGQFAAATAAALRHHCPPELAHRALPADRVDAKTTAAESNWWRPPTGTRTNPGLPALPTQMRTIPPASPPAAAAPGRRWKVPALLATIGVVVLAGTVTTIRWGGDHQHANITTPTAHPTPSPAPPPPPAVAPAALRGLLLPIDQIQELMGGMQPKVDDIDTPWDLSKELTDPECAGPYEAGQKTVYANDMYTGYQLQILVDSPQPLNTVTQAVIGFPDAAQARRAVDDQVRQWDRCANRTITYRGKGQSQGVTLGSPSLDAAGVHQISVQYQYGDQQHCQHALTARENVVVDVSACSVKPISPAAGVLTRIADRIPHP